MGMLAQIREAAKASPAGTPGPVTPPVPPLEGLVRLAKLPLLAPPHLGAALADKLRLPRALVGPPP